MDSADDERDTGTCLVGVYLRSPGCIVDCIRHVLLATRLPAFGFVPIHMSGWDGGVGTAQQEEVSRAGEQPLDPLELRVRAEYEEVARRRVAEEGGDPDSIRPLIMGDAYLRAPPPSPRTQHIRELWASEAAAADRLTAAQHELNQLEETCYTAMSARKAAIASGEIEDDTEAAEDYDKEVLQCKMEITQKLVAAKAALEVASAARGNVTAVAAYSECDISDD